MYFRNKATWAVALAFASTVAAQPPRTYQITTYVKCKPEMRTACEDNLVNQLGKSMKGRVDHGLITSFAVSRLVEPDASDAGFTHLYSISSTKPFPAEASEAYNKAGEQATGMTLEARSAKAAELYSRVSRVRTVTMTGLDPLVEKGDFVRAFFLKTPPGKQADLAQFMRNERQPFMKQIMQSGRHRTWGVREVLYRGTSDPYNAIELLVYKNAEMVMADSPDSDQLQAWYKNAQPTGNYQQFVARGRELRNVAMIRTFKVLSVIRK